MEIKKYFKQTVKILSIDGGGIRGYIPALILENLAIRLKEQGKSEDFSRHFDIVAGTSSGSLTALGITSPAIDKQKPDNFSSIPQYSISDIVNIYEVRRNDIFPRIPLAGIQTLRQAFHEKYDDSGFKKLLEDLFGNRTLADTLTNVLISSYDLKSAKPVMIRKSMLSETRENFYIKDIARGSSAAPTYFEPHTMTSLSGNTEYCLIDGAMAANNPALCAYVEARQLYPMAHKFIICSFGTGFIPHHWDYKKAQKWGFLDWISPQNGTPLYHIMTGAQEQCVDSQVSAIPEIEYYRINPILKFGKDDIDDTSIKNMKLLKSVAGKEIKEKTDILNTIAHIL